MEIIRTVSPWALFGSWLCFSLLLAANHVRVRALRRRFGIAEHQPSIRDKRSMYGLALEGLSFLIAFAFAQSPERAASWRHWLSLGSGALSVLLLGVALRHLDLQWRIKAVVTEDHRLVTSGPYGWVRHPVFLSLLGLLIATVALLTRAWAAWVAIAVCLYGTVIRIRAEDGLLARRFGQAFFEYQRRVAALLPGIY
ncbi:MAG: isoprenylcysteine carboxylmethyltransferase family protein [Bryobacteraceae bacterium]|nr:isoprenylcysteine carboxylmethyltransferase family protein [Bryobacteraceae bacterium]MDW8377145.1 isoprenylcysteine carboxylmethyltransferase family protein [Bryobacterales bacterium]